MREVQVSNVTRSLADPLQEWNRYPRPSDASLLAIASNSRWIDQRDQAFLVHAALHNTLRYTFIALNASSRCSNDPPEKSNDTHTHICIYIYTWRTGSLESRKSGVIGWSFKRDVGVRSGRSTSEIESWHAIRLDAWLSTFHFPRSTRILENSNYLSPPFDFLLLLLSSIFCPPSRAGSIDGRRTRFALEISKIGDHRAYRESSGMVGIFSEKWFPLVDRQTGTRTYGTRRATSLFNSRARVCVASPRRAHESVRFQAA